MSCPYCGSDESCEHHLLSVDIGEGRACGGELYELFNARLEKKLTEQSSSHDDRDESEALNECLAEVEQLAASSGREVGGGLSSGVFEDYFCSNVEQVVVQYASRYG